MANGLGTVDDNLGFISAEDLAQQKMSADDKDPGLVPTPKVKPRAAAVDESGFIPDPEPSPDADLGAAPVSKYDENGFIPDPEPQAIPPPPDMSAMRTYFEENLKKPREAKTFLDDWQAGWQMSVAGLGLTHRDMPDVILPDHADRAANIIAGIAQLAGDAPAMIAGMVGGAAGGGAAGSAVPIAGTAAGALVGGGAGAFALPAAIRTALMEHYKKGDIQTFDDFYDRASSVFWETAKAAATGAATSVAGPVVGKMAGPVLGTTAARLASVSAEIGTMTTVGAALNGHVPDANEFIDAGLLVALLHGVSKAGGGSAQIASKLREVYKETGVRPSEVANEARGNPILQQELLMANNELPSFYQPFAESYQGGKRLSLGEMGAVGGNVAELIKKDAPARTDAEAKILSQVGEQKPAPGKNLFDFRENYKNFVDRLDPINQAIKEMGQDPKELPTDQNPYQLARMANDYPAKVKHVIEKGTLDFKTLEINGKGLKEIVEPFREDLAGLDAYLLSKRALEVEGRGIKSGFDLEAAKQVVEQGRDKYDAAAKELVGLQNRNLQYLRDSGILSSDAFEKMKAAGEAYIPLKRVLEPEESAGGKSKGNPIKRLMGSDRQVQSPLKSILENTDAVFKAAEKNRASDAFARLSEFTGDTSILEKVPGSMRPIEVKADEVARFMKEHGIEGTPDSFSIFRGNPKNLAPNEIEVYRDGKREIFRTRTDLAEAFKSLDGNGVAGNVFLKMARGITAVKKIGITLTPDFILKNVFRDQLTAGAFTGGGALPFVDVFKAMGNLIKHDDTYYNWLKSGGAGGSFLELNENYLKKDVFKLNEETGVLDSIWNTIKTPADKLSAVGALLEHATRLAEFKRVSEGAASGEKVFAGGFSSREVTVDFSRVGAKVSALNSIVAFENVAIQGLDRTIRAIKDNPAEVSAKAMAYITVPSLLLWYANKDDERVKAIPRWERDTSWIIATDNWVAATKEDNTDVLRATAPHLVRERGGKIEINKGVIYRLPKPQELGILFGTLPERLMEKFFTDNPRALTDFSETMQNLVTPNLIPDALTPFIEQTFNKSLFTGGQLIPAHLEKVAPEYRYTEYTSETAKQLGKLTSYIPGVGATGIASPAVLDNYAQSWSGALGKYMLQIADQALIKSGISKVPPKPEATLSDIPAIKAFVVRYPNGGAQQIQDFKERYDRVQEKLNTLKLLQQKPGMSDEWQKYRGSMEAGQFVQLTSAKEALNNAAKYVHSINDNPTMSPKEKRQLIDGQYYFMIQLASTMNKMTDDLEKTIAQAERQKKK